MKQILKQISILALVAMMGISVQAQTITSNQTGNWNLTTTWVGGVVPVAGNNVVIAVGHTVTLVANTDITTGNLTVTGTLALAGFNLTAGSLAGAGTISSASGTPTVNVGSNGSSTTYSGLLSGPSALTKRGTGTLTLSGANTYTGITNVNAGILNIQHNDALGTTAGGTVVAAGAKLQLQNNITVTGEALTLNGKVVATGGTVTDIAVGGIDYRVHTFTSSGNFVVTHGGNVEYLVVAGGGGGGDAQQFAVAGGGGGAGGFRTGTGFPVTPQTYAITVGAGGVSGTTTSSSIGLDGGDGGNSMFSTITSIGGGGGGGAGGTNAKTGGSGGGGGSVNPRFLGAAGTAGQGNSGGNGQEGTNITRVGGGGGGASAVGGNGLSASKGGDGGAGSVSTITGASVTYAGGGGGGASASGQTPGLGGSGGGGNGGLRNQNGFAGAANTGGGGGGGSNETSTTWVATGKGGNGGSGIVIVRYINSGDIAEALENVSGNNTWTGTVTLATDNRINTTSGTFTVSGVISGAFAVTKTGTGTLTYAGDNTYTGSTTISAGTLSIGAGKTLTIGAGKTLTVASGATHIVDATANLTVAPGATINVNGTLTNNGTFTLQSDATGTANLGNSSGTITGNVTVQRFIPGGKRAFRFFSHPFSSPIALSNMMGSTGLIITGSGGATNGFDSTQNSKPSAFTFSESAYDGTNNSGWSGFTNTSNTIAVGAGIRALHRGARTQLPAAISSNPPTPQSATISWSGAISTGSKTFSMTNTGGGGNAGWNLIGNPYPSAINVGQVSGANRNNIAAFNVWNPNLATAGAYESKSFGTDYILPSGSAFIINTPSTANFTFSESDKSSSTPASLFKNSEWMQNALEITLLSDSSITWDNFTLRNRTQLTDAFEYTADGLKMKNSNVNFYTVSSDNKNLAIDNRPLDESKEVNLVFETSSPYHFTFKVSHIQMTGLEVYLEDKFTNKEVLLTANTAYDFVTTADAASQGAARFKFKFKTAPTTGVSELNNTNNAFSLYPNPASSSIHLSLANPTGTHTYGIYNQLGMLVKEGVLNYDQQRSHEINIETLSGGVYFIKLDGGQVIRFAK
jgi:autotransporter-associated beta strand protein